MAIEDLEKRKALISEISKIWKIATGSAAEIAAWEIRRQEDAVNWQWFKSNPGAYSGEWLILAVDLAAEKILVTAKDCVAWLPYNNEYVAVTWERCTLRQWLNNEYYNAFNREQKQTIAETAVINADNAQCGTAGGNDTTDKIFLLSIDEVQRYFSEPQERIAYYAGHPNTWWLRSPSINSYMAASVSEEGYLPGHGENVDRGFTAVRPAFWLKNWH